MKTSDETPRRPFRETPAPDGPPPPGMPRRYETHAPRLRSSSSAWAFGTGILAAVGLAAALFVIEFFAMLTVTGVVGLDRDSTTIATWVGLLVLAAGFGVAGIVSKRLPRAARASFWALVTVCLASMLILVVGDRG